MAGSDLNLAIDFVEDDFDEFANSNSSLSPEANEEAPSARFSNGKINKSAKVLEVHCLLRLNQNPQAGESIQLLLSNVYCRNNENIFFLIKARNFLKLMEQYYLIDPVGPGPKPLLYFVKLKSTGRKIGLGKEDYPFWKQIGKALLCTYTVFGLAWLWNETSPLGWWTLKPRPKEEREMAHLYERRQFPYPGDEEAVEKFIASGGTLGTTIGPKGFIDSDKDSENFQKNLQSQKFDLEAHKLWIRMRNEVILELQEKGYDIDYLMRPPQRRDDQ